MGRERRCAGSKPLAKTVAAKHIVDATVGRVGDQRSPLQFDIPHLLAAGIFILARLFVVRDW